MTQNAVRLSVPAETGWVSLVRSTAVAVASRVGFDLEQLEDIRLAVGEAAGLLAASAEPGSVIDVRLEGRRSSGRRRGDLCLGRSGARRIRGRRPAPGLGRRAPRP